MPDRQSPSMPMSSAALPLVYPVQPVEMQMQTVVYRSQPDLQLEADIYRPSGLQPGQHRLAVIMVHGGPVPRNSSPKSWRMFRDYAALLTGQGVIAIAFDHRLQSASEYFTAHGDVVALLEHVSSHAAEYQIDGQRLVLWAFSNGGPLLTAALDPPQARICGLIAYYCALELAGPSRAGVQSAPREILDRLSPVAQLRKHGCRASVLIARAGLDAATLNRSQASFMEAALARDVAVELLNHPTGGHAFDLLNDDARSREIIGRTLQFIRERAMT